MKKIFVLLIALVLYQNASPASYHLYVSPSGNYSNSGNKERPLSTLAGDSDQVRLLRERHVYDWDYGGWGLYTDAGSTGIIMENNLVYECRRDGFHQNYGKDNIIRNNIFALINTSAIQISRVEEHLSYTFTDNIIYQENGEIMADVWGGNNGTKIKVNYDRNCYWKAGEPSPKFYGLSFTEWQKLGRDKNSVVADPLFQDPENMDFSFKNLRIAKKIGFVPFDDTRAGVYGDEEWKKLARLKPELLKEFDEAVDKNIWKGK